MRNERKIIRDNISPRKGKNFRQVFQYRREYKIIQKVHVCLNVHSVYTCTLYIFTFRYIICKNPIKINIKKNRYCTAKREIEYRP